MTNILYTLRDPQSILGVNESQQELTNWFKTETILGEEPTVFSIFVKNGVATLTAKNRQNDKSQTVSVQTAAWDNKVGFRYLLLTNKVLILLKPAAKEKQ